MQWAALLKNNTKLEKYKVHCNKVWNSLNLAYIDTQTNI